MRKYLFFILALCIAFIPSLSMAGEYAMRGEELADINQKLDLLVLASDRVIGAVYDPVKDIVYIDWVFDDEELTDKEDAKALSVALKFSIPFFFEKNGIESSFEFHLFGENGIMAGTISPETNEIVMSERENDELVRVLYAAQKFSETESVSAFFNPISETISISFFCDESYKEMSLLDGDYSLLADVGMEFVELVSGHVPDWVNVRFDCVDIDGVYLYSIVDGELYQ